MQQEEKKLMEGIDYYINSQGLFVFTEKYLLERDYCCGNGCMHCPYQKDDGRNSAANTTGKTS